METFQSELAPNSSCNHEHKVSFKVANIEKFVRRIEKKRKQKKKKESKSLREFNSFIFGYASE